MEDDLSKPVRKKTPVTQRNPKESHLLIGVSGFYTQSFFYYINTFPIYSFQNILILATLLCLPTSVPLFLLPLFINMDEYIDTCNVCDDILAMHFVVAS